MLLRWFNARDAVKTGTELADHFAQSTLPLASGQGKVAGRKAHGEALRDFLRRAAGEARSLQLNFYKRAKLANSFKWRLVENGVDTEVAHDVTQSLVLSIVLDHVDAPGAQLLEAPNPAKMQGLYTLAEQARVRGAYAEAVGHYQEFIGFKPRDPDALNNLGVAFSKLGRYAEAELHFRKAIGSKPNYPQAHANLGVVRLSLGRFSDAENSLRRALKSNANDLEIRSNLGLVLVLQGRLPAAREQFEKVLRVSPRQADALYGMGLLARTEGRFDDADALFKRALEINPTMARAWSALVTTRRMSSSDAEWLKRAEQIATDSLAPVEEAGIRFAIGKYCDDAGDFPQAFKNYKRANDLLRTAAAPYNPTERTRFVDDMIRVYTRDTITRATAGGSTATRPVLVVGMMRSGTSLAEQILASHAAVTGAGELEFWNDAMRQHETAIRQEVLSAPTRERLAAGYLRTLTSHSADALRIVDKAPANSDYLGVIHSVFPNVRVIYMQRDPIDTCLSCYFQPFSATLNFSMDLSDLAHYYREHHRLIAHWRAVLPPGTILDVPYEGLVADQEGWTRRMLEFLGLEWDERCLDFHRTQRPVVTSSFWQVRQRLYSSSVQRWHNYRKFIGPLLSLRRS